MSVGRKIGLGVVALFALAVLFFIEEHFRGKIALRKWKQRIEAKGEVLRVERLEPPRVPAEKNGMPAFIWAAGQLSGFPVDHQPPTRFVAPGKALVVTKMNGWTIRSGSNVTNVLWQDITASLEDRRSAIDGALEALEAEFLQANVHYAGGFSTPLPHLARMKSAAQVILAAAVYDLHKGKVDDAVQTLELVVGLLEKWRDERLIISQLVRIAVGQISFLATWQAVQTQGLTDEHLMRLQERWSKLEFLNMMENAVAMERAMACAELESFRNSTRGLSELDPGVSPPQQAGAQFSLTTRWFLDAIEQTPVYLQDQVWTPIWKFAWSCHDELHFCRTVQGALDLQRQAGKSKMFRPVSLVDPASSEDPFMELLARDPTTYSFYDQLRFAFSSMVLGTYSACFRRAWIMQTTKELAVAGIALRRYELKRGQNAPSLDALVSELLTQPAWDYLDGKPLKYRMKDRKPVLYSVGEDGVDHGGNPQPKGNTRTFNFQNGRDLVWPQPATAEEIEAYDKRARAE